MLANRSPSSLRRSPLLVCILLVLVVQSYFLFKYNTQATSNLCQNDLQTSRLEEHNPSGNVATSTVTVTRIAPPPLANTAQPQSPQSQKTSGAIRQPPLYDVVLSIKTGSTVIHARVPIQLLTIVPNFPNTLIFSDLKTKLGDWEVADALQSVSSDVAGNTLTFWRDLQTLKSQNAGLMDSDGKLGDLKQGWALDKFKNIPILIESYQKHPHASYYLYIDGDTSLITSNFFPYLLGLTQKHDPLTDPVYYGSLALLNDVPFAHGGSGYLINQAAMRKMFPPGKAFDEAFLLDLERNYTALASTSCCGDLVLGQAMIDRANVELKHKWPFFQGESWWAIPYHGSNFCQKMGTLHHATPEDMQEIWEFEQAMIVKTGMDRWRPSGWKQEHEDGLLEWKFSDLPSGAKNMDVTKYKYILFRDMYDWFISTRLPKKVEKDDDGVMTKSATKVGWDNRSWKEWELNKDKVIEEGTEEWKKDAILSEKDCRIACEEHYKECVQWYYREGVCGLSDKVVYGRRLRNDGTYSEWKKLGVSGWIPDRVEKAIKGWREKCPGQSS